MSLSPVNERASRWLQARLKTAVDGACKNRVGELNEPIDQQIDDESAIVITSGDPGEVVGRLTESGVTVAEYAVDWQGPRMPLVQPIVAGTVNWIAVSADAAIRAVKALLIGARESR